MMGQTIVEHLNEGAELSNTEPKNFNVVLRHVKLVR